MGEELERPRHGAFRRTRWASLLIAFYVLTAAATAHAECAWVLWMEETRQDFATKQVDRRWHTPAAAGSHVACEKRLLQEIETLTHPQNPPKRVMHKVSAQSVVEFYHFESDDPKAKSSRYQRFAYTCLPDTVDPRGPKGR